MLHRPRHLFEAAGTMPVLRLRAADLPRSPPVSDSIGDALHAAARAERITHRVRDRAGREYLRRAVTLTATRCEEQARTSRTLQTLREKVVLVRGQTQLTCDASRQLLRAHLA